MARALRTELQEAERRLLEELRGLSRGLRTQKTAALDPDRLTLGQDVADKVAATMGSWRFIIIQTGILFLWIVLNVTAYVQRWDPYPFILLNLALSFQAAYAAPFIMMSQNRQQDIDRKKAESDYNINIKAELEIELLHQKIDELREKEMLALTAAISDLTQHVKDERLALDAARPSKPPTAPKAAAPKVATLKAATPKAPAAAKSPASPKVATKAKPAVAGKAAVKPKPKA